MTQRRGNRESSSRSRNKRSISHRAANRHRLLRGELLEPRALLTAAPGTPSPWMNPLDPLDVDGDTRLSPTDAVLVINYLNSPLPAQLPAEYVAPEACYDVDGDLNVSPSDAVLVINALNEASQAIPSEQSTLSGMPGIDASMAAQMVIDINREPQGLPFPPFGFREIGAVGNRVFFPHNDGTHGRELWVTDGTAAGTRMVRDLRPGPTESNFFDFTNLNGRLFFAVQDDVVGWELWTSDGTEEGTFLFKDIRPGPGSSNPSNFVSADGMLYFSANDGVTGAELWKSDGTQAGTVRVADINAGSGNSYPRDLIQAGGQVFFFVGTALWRSDGTAAGTAHVRDFPSLLGSPAENYRAAVGETLFLSIDDGVHGRELWKSDGTPAGTVLVKDIRVNILGSDPSGLTNVNGTLFFSAQDGVHGSELWKSDGTTEGTALVRDIKAGPAHGVSGPLENVGGRLFFAADDGIHGHELWQSNGTAESTSLVKDIKIGNGFLSDASPSFLTNVNGTLFFVARHETYGSELWKSDGTASGTVLVKDVLPGSSSYTYPAQLTNANGTLFFRHKSALNFVSLWKSDGTEAGTIEVPRDTVSTLPAFKGLGSFTVAGSQAFFEVNDGTYDRALWRTDGTAEGTRFVKSLNFATYFTNVNGTLFFRANEGVHGNEIWKTDGTPEGTVLVCDVRPGKSSSYARYLTNVNGTLYFRANDGMHGDEIWKSDGTAEGTVLVKDVTPGLQPVLPGRLTAVGDTLYFSANDGLHGYELWKSDGTAAGTVMITDGLPGRYGSGPGSVTNVNGSIYFTAVTATDGRELWKTDGTAGSTIRVKDIVPGLNAYSSSIPRDLTNLNGRLVFTADDKVHGRELWTSDGTEAGTVLLKDIMAGEGDPHLENFTVVNDTVFFVANDGIHGAELWKTDGTATGTVLVKETAPGIGDSARRPRYFANAEGTLFFSAEQNSSRGFELWYSDGTAVGTHQLEIIPGSPSSAPHGFVYLSGRLLFAAYSLQKGRELFTLIDINGAPTGADHSVTTRADTPYRFSTSDFGFADPTDSPADSLLGVIISALPDAGRLTLGGVSVVSGQLIPAAQVADGLLQYFPATNAATKTSLRFQVQDGGGTTHGGTDIDLTPNAITLVIAPVNDPPVAVDDEYSVAEDTPFSFPGRGVLFNDSDPEGDELTAVLETGPAHGVLVLEENGDFLYTPEADYNGPDSFTYRASDGEETSDIATVSLNVNAVNDAPVGVTDQYSVPEDMQLTVAAPGVLLNDRDIDGDSLTASLVGVLIGHVALQSDGSFVYTPPTDFSGEDRFLYVVSDDAVTSTPVEVVIHVQAVNDAPIATDDHYEATSGVPLTVPAPGALANDSDAEGDALTMSIGTGPAQGTLVLTPGGGFTYTPDPGFSGQDSFTYQVGDGRAFSNVATVVIDVAAGGNRPQVTLGADASLDEGGLFSRSGSFTDADSSDSWSATVDYGDGSGPAPLALSANKTFSLSHVYRDNGMFAVRVVVTDASGAAGSATIQVQVRNVAPQSLTFTGPAVATRGQSASFTGRFTDPGVADLHTARIVWGDGSVTTPAVTAAAGGVRQVLASHTYTSGGIYEPVLTVTDDDGGRASQRMTVVVAGVGLDRGVLEIVGSAVGDSITVAFMQGSLSVFGSLGGATLSRSFNMGDVQRIVAILGDGSDRLTVSSTVTQPVLIDGGGGSDTLFAGSGQAIMLGGAGDDAMRGGPGRDVLIGGVGQDQLNASGGGDLLIAGWTQYDADYVALAAIFAEWNAAGSYQDRVQRLRSGSGSFVQPQGIKLAHNQTVFDDTVADTLWGGSELDWFFLDLARDQLRDRASGELIR